MTPSAMPQSPSPRWTQAILAFVLLGLSAPSPALPPISSPAVGRSSEAGEYATNNTLDIFEVPSEALPLQQRTQHLVRLGLEAWHRQGYRGKGVKVAVLDSGFRGYREHLGKALPKQVQVRSFRTDRNLEARDSQHGILCAEVIHAIAPDAELLFANWEPDRPDSFLDAARWARQQGAKILSCSVIMPSWSDGEGNGPIHEELQRILGEEMLFFASAGNIAQRHYAGTFQDDGRGRHEWKPGRTVNLLTPWGDERVSVELTWQPGAEYEIVVHDATNGEEVGRDCRKERGPRCAAVRFLPQARSTYYVTIRLISGKPALFHLISLGAGLQHSTAAGSITFPADGPEVIAVGAVDADERRLVYSSCGPNSSRPKPDLSAVVPFPSVWRSRPFTGTSAAAPQAAGLAAVCWSRWSEWKSPRLREMLTRTAKDLGDPGHDCETGYGLAMLPNLD